MEDYIAKTTAQWESAMAPHTRMPLWAAGHVPGWMDGVSQREPSIVPFLLPGEERRGAVIVCAGGAYRWKEPPEAFPHAQWLNAIGLHALVLDYRVMPYAPLCILQDAQRAIRVLRHMGDAWRIKENSIGIMGFSAGGHLTAMASGLFDGGNPVSDDPVERVSCRPDAQVLCYPHITYTPYATADPAFMNAFFGGGYTREDIDAVNADRHVRADSPPAFLWGTQGDYQYQQKQWACYADALEAQGVPLSYHVFPGGSHGEGRERSSPVWKQWTTPCETWLMDLGF